MRSLALNLGKRPIARGLESYSAVRREYDPGAEFRRSGIGDEGEQYSSKTRYKRDLR